MTAANAFLSAVFQGLTDFGNWLEAHGAAIAALATLAVAAFTLTLWRATSRLWRVNIDALQHSRETAERQLRAYVFVRDVEVSNINVAGRITVKVTIKNFGQTPAYKMAVVSNVSLEDLPLKTYGLGSMVPVPLSDLGPGDEVSSIGKHRELTRDQKAGIRKGNKALYLQGVITYVDAFNRQRRTDFARVKRMLGGTRMDLAETGNTAT